MEHQNSNNGNQKKGWRGMIKGFVKGVKIPEKIHKTKKEDNIDNLRRINLHVYVDYITMKVRGKPKALIFDRKDLSTKEGKMTKIPLFDIFLGS